MRSKLGLRLSERMAGWIQFLKQEERIPFDFKIHGFTRVLWRYPFFFEFKGVSRIGLGTDPFPIYGQFKISHRGVQYQISAPESHQGPFEIRANKTYQWWSFRWRVFRDSLVSLRGDVKNLSQETIANFELKYLLPLWFFPFGLRLTRASWAYRPRGSLAMRFYSLARFVFPGIDSLGDEKTLTESIEKQLNLIPRMGSFLLHLSMLLIRMLAWILFIKPVARLSARQGERLLRSVRRNSILKLMFMPLLVAILYPLFGQKKFLKRMGQNIITPPQQAENEPWMAQVWSPRIYQEPVIEADCVVVGSGAGGAVVAYELARQGKAVAIIEEGHYFKRPDLSGITSEMMNKLYQNSGIQFSVSNSVLWIPTGKCVGGTTFINSGTCVRTPKSILDHWENALGLSAKVSVGIESQFDEIEEMLGSTPAVKKELLGGIYRVIKKGIEGTPYQLEPLHRAEIGCDGQASCILGCPTDAKRSTAVSFIPEALKRGALLLTHLRAEKIIIEKDRAVGISAHVAGFGPEFHVSVRAPLVVVAGGTFRTPELLHRSGLWGRSNHLGRHLTIHPALTVGGLFQEKVRETFFVPQSLGIFGVGQGDYVLEGYTMPVDAIPAAFGLWGKELLSVMNRIDGFTNFSSMHKDQGEGRLLMSPWGALPYYHFSKNQIRSALESICLIAKIFFNGSAKKVYLPVQGREVLSSLRELNEFINEKISPSRLVVSAHHPLGTCRMAGDPKTGVVSEEGEFFGIKNLVIADGSVIPGPLGVNPQVTIMANAMRIAKIWSNRV